MGEENPVSGGVPASRRGGSNTWSTLAALLIFGVGTTLRLVIALRHSDSPAIDENDVVEQATVFMGPDLKHYFVKYGPLTMYALSGIYRVAAWLHGQTNLEYASRVFLEGEEQYAIARAYTYGWLSILAIASFFVLRRQLGSAAALLSCTLLSFPLVDVLLDGIRIDAPQAALQGLALLALTEVVSPPVGTEGRVRPSLRYWLAAGGCAGLAFATKPLPGLLIAPAFLVASWSAAARREDGSARPLLGRLGATVGSKGLWLAALVCAACAVAGDPALLDLHHFVKSQVDAVVLHSGNATVARFPIDLTFARLQTPFLVAVAVSAVLLALRREPRAAVIAIFVIVYVGAFVGRANRRYFMVAPAAALCLFVAYGWAELGRRLADARFPRRDAIAPWARWAWAPLALLMLWRPVRICWNHSLRISAAVETRRWVEAHIPPGTRIFHLGERQYGTYLVPRSEKIQATWGDHFHFGRKRYPFYREAFHLGYTNYAKSGKPRYSIEARDEDVYPRSAKKNKRWITDGLVKRARERKQKLIIISRKRQTDVRGLGYTWFDQAKLEAQFGRVAIFSVPDETPRATSSGGDTAKAGLADASPGTPR